MCQDLFSFEASIMNESRSIWQRSMAVADPGRWLYRDVNKLADTCFSCAAFQ